MATLAEQLAAMPVLETLATNPGTLTKLPWATNTGTFGTFGTNWHPEGYILTPEPASLSGIYYNAAEEKGGRAAVGFRYSEGSLANADRRVGCWLFTAAGAKASGYQLQWDTISEAAKVTWRLTRWDEGVGTVLAEWEEPIATGDSYFLSAFDGTVTAWRQVASELPVAMKEVKDGTYTSGRGGLDGNGSNPNILDFRFGALVTPTVEPRIALPRRRLRRLRVVSIASGGEGQGYELSGEVEGLRWSSTNPGGDEVCNFSVSRSWFATNPDLARGNLLRIMDGVDVLWQGRIEETDRGGDNNETIAVTAYGLGARLKDGTFREIFIDPDSATWGEPTINRKIQLNAGGFDLSKINVSQSPTGPGGTGGPTIIFELSTYTKTNVERGESWYFAGIDIGRLRYDFIVPKAGGTELLTNAAALSTNDVAAAVQEGTNHKRTAAANQEVVAPDAGYQYAYFKSIFEANELEGQSTGDNYGFSNMKVEGTHGLTPSGTWPNIGFTVDQMVGFLVAEVSGVITRRIDPQTYIVQSAAFKDPVSQNDAITELNKYEGCNWGTWGPDSPLDLGLNGQFDFTNTEPGEQHWFLPRRDADNVDLHSETSTLFAAVDVSYEGADGVKRVVRRSTVVPDLDAAGLTRVAEYNLGKGELADAEAAGDLFLAVWGQFAPARGSVTVKGTCRHRDRGDLPVHYMRANGSNLRIPDILPASTAISLDSEPDRRTTFPIQRVEVDASGAVPTATVELDQANDSLSVMQARTELAQSLLPT